MTALGLVTAAFRVAVLPVGAQFGVVRAYVGVTDRDWYGFLAGRPALNEVNFWRSGGGRAFGC
jgi:hypothetical protein